MAKIQNLQKNGRPKEYTGKAFASKVEAYFKSISFEEPYTRAVPVTDDDGNILTDDYGHTRYRNVPVITADGKEATTTVWIEPPSLTGLCLFLGIHRSTFARYGQLDPEDAETEEEAEENERFRNTVIRARGRVEAYLEGRLEDKGAQRGVEFNLQHNFGWKTKREVSLDADTRKSVETLGAGTTDADRIKWLKEAGVDVSAWEDRTAE